MIKTNIREVSQQYSRYKARESRDKYYSLKEKLNDLENLVYNHPSSKSIWSEIASVKSELEIHEMNKAMGAQVRSRIKYIQDGEKCTRYFLNLEKHYSKNNTITKLINKKGETITNETELLQEIADKYANRYNQVNNNYNDVALLMDEFIQEVDLPTLSDNEVAFCDSPITEKELAKALKGMKNGSSPGYDGIPTEFYKVFWSDIKAPLLECYNYSFVNDCLSPSEKIGVISLFHKGKDLAADTLDNWRPITLTCVDYKIIAKVLSLRLNNVIDKLIGEQQSGFIKGRNISLVHRQIDDLLQLQRNKNVDGILLALDFKQAFDAIDVNCIFKSLEIFGFGNNFIRWIRILNHQRIACVKNGGHISGKFPMNNGVRQGCPISPQLFILAAEILAQKIIQDDSIFGLNPHNGSKSIKVCQYADDTSLFLKSGNDVNTAFNHLNGFSTFSNLFLNINKSYALSTNGMAVDTGGIEISFKNTIKILGIYFSNQSSASELEINWKSRIDNIKRLFASWSKRDLSIIGKIHIIKTFGVSQFIYLLNSISLPKKVLDEINRIFFSFVWKKRPDNKKTFEKVKRSVMSNELEKGGLKMINVHTFHQSVLLSWAEALLNPNTDSVWQQMASKFFNLVGGKLVFRSKVDYLKFKGFHLIPSLFWRDVLSTWLMLSDRCVNIIKPSDPIFNNESITYKSQTLFLITCIKKKVLTVGDVISSNRIITYEEFTAKYGTAPSNLLDYNVIYNALENIIHKISHEQDDNYYFRGIPIGKFGRKQFEKQISMVTTPTCVGTWKRKYGIDVNSSHWKLLKDIKESRLRALCWKIMHNIYPTNIMLFKMNIALSQNCTHCNVVDFSEHFFYHCELVKDLWLEIEKHIITLTNINIKLNESAVLLGYIQKNSIPALDIQTINKLIAIGKLAISKFKYGKQRNLIEIFESECNIRSIDLHI